MTATTPYTLAQIEAKKSATVSNLKLDAGMAATGIAVAAVAVAFFPPLGIVGALGAMIGISNTIDAAASAAKLGGLKKAEKELAEGKTENTRRRADMLASLAKPGRTVALIAAASILVLAVVALAAPAVISVAAFTTFANAVAWPTLGLLAASKAVGGSAAGAQAVVDAADNPAPPAPPAAAAPEAAPKTAKGFKLRSLLGVFGGKAAPANANAAPPANDDAKPAVPEAKAAAPKP